MKKTSVILLLILSALCVALALCGADRALAIMKHPVTLPALGLLAGVTLLPLLKNLFPNGRGRPHQEARTATGRKGRWCFLAAIGLFHAGFALVLVGWLFSASARSEEGYLQLRAGQTGAVGEAFEFTLEDFSITHWPDTGTVKQYQSRGLVRTPGGGTRATPVTIDVNHPLVRDGWWVYQNSYQEATSPHTHRPFYFTLLLCVKDAGLAWVAPGGLALAMAAFLWLFAPGAARGAAAGERPLTPLGRAAWLLYGGAFIGALAMLVHRGLATGHAPLQNMYEFLIATAALLPVLTLLARRERHALLTDAALQAFVLIPVAFFMDGRVKHLMPALQSPFFVPHVGAYVLGYLLLVRAAFGVGRNLVRPGFFLLTLGLVLGAAWGKVCWGHWWQFDPKEMWSLATWFVYAAYFHLTAPSARLKNGFLAAGAVMIVLTLTWINLSRLFTGMHSYA